MRRITTIALLSAGVIALGGLSAACEPANNEPQAKRTVAERPATAAEKAPAPEASEAVESVSEANARASAEQYLSGQSFSRKGLIEQLKFEGFSTADATYGVGAVSVDWNEQAARSAEQYLSGQSFSRSGLIEQLEYEGYTGAQARYGVNQTGL